ncbi:transcriptional regulator, TetR family [Agromyces sp. CF514]|uniref:TetR/AcrR family transcriptional regulator n=1 Tax=Agromyces sp. CF514 TaxID=1881031 RepID=UPI0008E9847E|nr:TetR/AcrR family transcriptional regulator [Agromyces sp. CF514]SFR91430.1 transcriptional regulator, TetR family [Agromyces sp. CF514]
MPNVTDEVRRAPRRDAAANREALLAAASTALSENPDASLEAIASAAGLSRRALYGHFAGRDELIDALIASGATRLNAIAAETDHPDAATAIAMLGARLWRAVGHVRILAAMAVREPHVERAAGALAPLREHLGELVARGVDDGRLRGDIRPSTLARLIERSAIAVLLEASVAPLSDADGHRLVMASVLGTAGLGWREAGDLIDTAPELSMEAFA